MLDSEQNDSLGDQIFQEGMSLKGSGYFQFAQYELSAETVRKG